MSRNGNQEYSQKELQQMAKVAKERNAEQTLECTECCTVFRLKKNGQWRSGEKKVADLVAGRLLVCTCGTPVGVVITPDMPCPVVGEVVAVH